MRGWVDVVEVGNEERRFIGPELGKESPGLSGQFVFCFVYVRWWSIEEGAVRNGR